MQFFLGEALRITDRVAARAPLRGALAYTRFRWTLKRVSPPAETLCETLRLSPENEGALPLDRDVAIEKLERQIARAEELKRVKRASPDFKKWHRDTEVAIENIFGPETRHTEDFTSIRYSLSAFTSGTPDYRFQEAYVSGLAKAQAVLRSFIDEIEEYWEEETDAQRPHPLSRIALVFNRFHLIARRLRSRYDDRATLDVRDEYDVQDLLHSLLTLDFDDIRREEWTPSYAGGSARMDFLLKEQEVVVELKKTRRKLSGREVGDQLIVDIARYREHPSCSRLVCFVYDPEGLIGNPSGLEVDLTRTEGDLEVQVIVAPKGV